MKTLKNIFPLVFLLLGLSSCLDDEYLTGINGDSPNIIDFLEQPDASVQEGEIYPVYIRSVPISSEEEIIIPISYSGSNQAPEDIVVDVAIDETMLQDYNMAYEEHAIEVAIADLGQDPSQEEIDEATEIAIEDADAHAFTLIPSSLFTMPNQVTIKKGERHADLVLKVNSEMFDFDYKYGLPLKLSSSQGMVSSNFGDVIFQVGGKNEWDGIYNYKTSANTSLVPNRNSTTELHTVSARKLRIIPGLLDNYTNEVYYTIHEDNSITVECPSLGVQEPQDPRSKYDPATKTLQVYWKQGNGGRTFEETFTFTGQRP